MIERGREGVGKGIGERGEGKERGKRGKGRVTH